MVTREFKETVLALLRENADNVSGWLRKVAEGDAEHELKPDPGRALDLLSKLAEYATPKLARTELTGEGGGAVKFTRIEAVIVDPDRAQG
jgi:hypothetical protein